MKKKDQISKTLDPRLNKRLKVPASSAGGFSLGSLPRRQAGLVYSLTRVSGFTLVEILVALVILSTGLVVVIEGMARSQQGMRVAENLILASQIAEEKITESELDLHQYHKLPGGSSDGRETFPGKVFQWKKIIEAYTHETIKDETKLNQVSVQVNWKEAERNNQLILSTLLLNREKEAKA